MRNEIMDTSKMKLKTKVGKMIKKKNNNPFWFY